MRATFDASRCHFSLPRKRSDCFRAPKTTHSSVDALPSLCIAHVRLRGANMCRLRDPALLDLCAAAAADAVLKNWMAIVLACASAGALALAGLTHVACVETQPTQSDPYAQLSYCFDRHHQHAESLCQYLSRCRAARCL